MNEFRSWRECSFCANLVEYDRQAEVVQMTDQNGTQHDYTLDGLGRQVSDTATVLPAYGASH